MSLSRILKHCIMAVIWFYYMGVKIMKEIIFLNAMKYYKYFKCLKFCYTIWFKQKLVSTDTFIILNNVFLVSGCYILRFLQSVEFKPYSFRNKGTKASRIYMNCSKSAVVKKLELDYKYLFNSIFYVILKIQVWFNIYF